MKFKITERKEWPLLFRTEVMGFIEDFDATPSNLQVRKTIAENVKTSEDNVVVKSIKGKYGKRSASFIAYIYKDSKSKERVELRLGKKALERLNKKSTEIQPEEPKQEPKKEQSKQEKEDKPKEVEKAKKER